MRIIKIIIKTILTFLAITNLFLLFVMNYELPKKWTEKFPVLSFLEKKETEQEQVIEEEKEAWIKIPMNSIKYNGTGTLDLLKGIYIVNKDGTIVKDAVIKTAIQPTSNRNEKKIIYTSTQNNTKLTGERTLSLGNNYTGPSITVTGKIPFCQEEDRNYTDTIVNSGVISAENGFKKDITDKINISLKRYDASEEEAILTATVTNEFGDSYSVDIQAPMNKTGIVLRLKTGHITIPYNSKFSIKDYVEDCYGPEGDLTGNLTYSGDINTSVPGEYVLSVYTSYNGEQSIHRELKVNVEEPEEENPN